jgi:hypothetical protein
MEITVAMERQRDLIALRAEAPRMTKPSEMPLAGNLKRHLLPYKNCSTCCASCLRMWRATLPCCTPHTWTGRGRPGRGWSGLFAAPGTMHLGARSVTGRLMPATTTQSARHQRLLARRQPDEPRPVARPGPLRPRGRSLIR